MEAINRTREFHILYPSSHEEQRKIARERVVGRVSSVEEAIPSTLVELVVTLLGVLVLVEFDGTLEVSSKDSDDV